MSAVQLTNLLLCAPLYANMWVQSCITFCAPF